VEYQDCRFVGAMFEKSGNVDIPDGGYMLSALTFVIARGISN